MSVQSIDYFVTFFPSKSNCRSFRKIINHNDVCILFVFKGIQLVFKGILFVFKCIQLVFKCIQLVFKCILLVFKCLLFVFKCITPFVCY